MENGRIRIVDIADELGLSTATVSNVIHGKTKKISDETVAVYTSLSLGIPSQILGLYTNDTATVQTGWHFKKWRTYNLCNDNSFECRLDY